ASWSREATRRPPVDNPRLNTQRRLDRIKSLAANPSVEPGQPHLKQDEVLAALQRDLQAARYAAQRAQKQYDAADPENRLVADELERRWNDALLRVEEVESRIEQQTRTSGQTPAAQPDEFADLAAALESIWPQADARLKKRIVRTHDP
ncbi:hypothetical protein V4C53_47400, partial [Paraburkholderia azotifigens]